MANFVSVKMVRNDRGAPDGIHIREYEKDVTYELPEDLARAFVEELKSGQYVNRFEKRGRGQKVLSTRPTARSTGQRRITRKQA